MPDLRTLDGDVHTDVSMPTTSAVANAVSLDTHVGDLECPVRLQNLMRSVGIGDLRDLRGRCVEDLLRVPGLGRKSLGVILHLVTGAYRHTCQFEEWLEEGQAVEPGTQLSLLGLPSEVVSGLKVCGLGTLNKIAQSGHFLSEQEAFA